MGNYLLLKDHVYNYIVEQINNGNLAAGSKINETDIIKELKVSRTPVREALIQLAADGLLDNIPRRGFIIKKLTIDEAKETFFIIGALDGAATELSTPLLTEKLLKEMEFYIQSIDLAIETGNIAMYHKMQESFHQVYLSICPNQSLVELLLKLQRKFLKRMDGLGDIEFTRKKLAETNNEHRQMLTFFRNGDTTALKKFMQEVHWNPVKAEIIPL